MIVVTYSVDISFQLFQMEWFIMDSSDSSTFPKNYSIRSDCSSFHWWDTQLHDAKIEIYHSKATMVEIVKAMCVCWLVKFKRNFIFIMLSNIEYNILYVSFLRCRVTWKHNFIEIVFHLVLEVGTFITFIVIDLWPISKS